MADIAIRDFAMSYADLIGLCNTIQNCMLRDEDEFEGYGVSSSLISDFEDSINDFTNLPTDSELSSNVVIATEEKYSAAQNLRIMLRSFTTRAKITFGENSGKYSKFTVKELSKISDNDLMAFGEKVIRSSEEYLSDLSSAGVTTDLIDELRNLLSIFKEKKENQENEVMNRDDATNNRTKKANELYNLLSKYCDIGKTIWYEVNEAKYNDYIIYRDGGSSSQGGGGGNPQLTAPANFRYDYAELTIRWNSVSGATSYQVEFSEDNVNWEVIYEGYELEFLTSQMLPEHTYLRARSRNSGGFSGYTPIVNIIYELTLPMAQNLTYIPAYPGFNWDVVPGAINYEVQLRNQNSPHDDWLRIYFGNDNTLYHADPIGSYVYRIRSWNNSGTSVWAQLSYFVSP